MPLAVALAAAAIATPGAFQHALYGDEVASARVVSEPNVARVLQHVRRTESTPPAWYLLAWSLKKADAGLTGARLFADVSSLRLLSVLFAAAAAALTSLLALRILGDRLPAALAGSLVALGSVPAEYAEQLRAYALVVLLSAIFGLLLVEATSRPKRRSLWALAATVWVGLLTHYFFFFIVAAGALWLWIARPRPVAAGKVTLAIGVGATGFLPWLPAFLDQQSHGRYRWIGGFNAREVAVLPGSLFFGPDGVFYGLCRLAITLLLIIGSLALWRRPEGRAVVSLGLIPIVVAGAVWAAGAPIFDQRNMLPVAPFLAILVAAGIQTLPMRLAPTAAATTIALALIGAVYAQATLGRVAYDSVAQALSSFGWSSRDSLLVDYPNVAANRRGAGIQITSAMSWYLPGRPLLVWAPGKHDCSSRYAIVQVLRPTSWLARYAGRVAAAREFTFYDHPILGRPRGRIIVARFREGLSLRGAFFSTLGHRVPCRLGG